MNIHWIHQRPFQLGVVVLVALCTVQASAGTLRDAIREQRAGAAQNNGIHNSSNDMDDSSDSGMITLPAGTRTLRDLAYGPDSRQRMDVYIPANARADSPILFMVHGGAWKMGDKRASAVVTHKAAYWLPKGYVMVSTNYRLFPAADPIEQAHDVARAIAFAHNHARDWGADPKRLLLMGHSAGAHLVSLLAAAPEIATTEGALPWLGTIALDTAAFDVAEIMSVRHYRFYDQVFGDDPDFWRRASPTSRINSAPKPFLAVCSTKRDNACTQAKGFAARVTSVGGQITVLPVDLRHLDINEQLGKASPYTDSVDAFVRSLGLP